jgi:hypothetical protein
MNGFKTDQPRRDSLRFPASITAGYRPAADRVLIPSLIYAFRTSKRGGL